MELDKLMNINSFLSLLKIRKINIYTFYNMYPLAMLKQIVKKLSALATCLNEESDKNLLEYEISKLKKVITDIEENYIVQHKYDYDSPYSS